jgi:hypothetical protein
MLLLPKWLSTYRWARIEFQELLGVDLRHARLAMARIAHYPQLLHQGTRFVQMLRQ